MHDFSEFTDYTHQSNGLRTQNPLYIQITHTSIALYYTDIMQIMYYRINIISFDASRKDEYMAYFDSVRDRIKAISGLQSLNVIETGEGEAVGVACYDSKESAEDAFPTVKEIMGGMAQFFTGPPELKLGPIMWSL